MARVFIEGFEFNQFSAWNTESGSPALVDAATYDMTGSYCVYLTGDVITTPLPNMGTVYLSFKFRTPNRTTHARIVEFRKSGVAIGAILLNTGSFKLMVYRSGYAGTLLDTGTTVLQNDTVYLIECKYIPHTSTGTFIVKCDGITEINIDGNGNTTPVGYTSVDLLRLADGASANGAYYDDIVVDSASWIGQSYIEGIVPSGAGSNTNWTPSAGNNYECVDEFPHTSDTDYVATNSNDVVDSYAMGNMTAGSINSIKCIQVHAMARREETSTPTKVGITVVSGVTTDVATGQSVAQSENYNFYRDIWEDNPDDSQPWEEADVNGMEAGVKSLA